MQLTGGICEGVLVKDYAVYKKWMSECMIVFRHGLLFRYSTNNYNLVA